MGNGHLILAALVVLLAFHTPIVRAESPAAPREPSELRAVWVSRFHYRTAAEVQNIVRDVKAMGANAIFFQVRGEADAFYRSRYEPWSARLTGTLGRDPGWDPLQTALQAARASGLELHAWINTFSAWRTNGSPPSATPNHVLNAHPDWVAVDRSGYAKPPVAEYVSLSPGNPAVQDHIRNVVLDIVASYPVDGIHFDYVRYSGPLFSFDATSQRRLESPADNPRGLSRADWQREQITGLLARIYRDGKAVRPSAQMSAAVWGVYRNVWGWQSSAGYDQYYQDSREWLRRGAVDFIVPMTYWTIGGMPDYGATVKDFLGQTHGRGVFPSVGVHRLANRFDEVEAQIELARREGARGIALFSYAETLPFKDRLASGPFRLPASTPWSNGSGPRPEAPRPAPPPPPRTDSVPKPAAPPTPSPAPRADSRLPGPRAAPPIPAAPKPQPAPTAVVTRPEPTAPVAGLGGASAPAIAPRPQPAAERPDEPVMLPRQPGAGGPVATPTSVAEVLPAHAERSRAPWPEQGAASREAEAPLVTRLDGAGDGRGAESGPSSFFEGDSAEARDELLPATRLPSPPRTPDDPRLLRLMGALILAGVALAGVAQRVERRRTEPPDPLPCEGRGSGGSVPGATFSQTALGADTQVGP